MKPQSIWLIVFLPLWLTVSVHAQEVNCANGIDDDGDGQIDCFDNDCASSPLCQNRENNCNDGLDNDGDGLPDCLDDDCKGTSFCPVETDCNNGIDDDGDGFFDYYDGDCLAEPTNPNDFIIDVVNCEVRPNGNSFSIEKAWDSPMQTSATRGSFALADLDNDGIAEVVSYNDETGYMYVLDGRDGSIKNQVKVTNKEQFASYPAVADVDGDGFGEIFHIDRDGKVRSYNHDLSTLWPRKDAPIERPRPPLLADFNQDGNTELYYVNEIRNAATGNLLIKGSHGKSTHLGGNNWNDELAGVPVAIDILPASSCSDCDGLELALGHVVYSVDLVNNTLTERLNMDNVATKIGYYDANGYFPKRHSNDHNWSSTSVADYNQDGYLDIICSGTTGNLDGPTTIFFWDVRNDVVRTFIPTRPASTIPGGFMSEYRDHNGTKFWRKGVGALNIANIDADPELECTFMSGSSLYALDVNWNLEWANYTDYWEGSSGFTSTAVFDFDGDGASEIVYRDEINLHIVDGFTGDPITQYADADFCSSNTHAEYPIVADVDGDGETEIVVVCGRDQNYPNQGTRTGGGNQRYGFVRAYKAAPGTFWVPSRSLWNQFAYFNVNINDDLSIPRYQQQHHLGFAQECNLLPGGTAGFSLNKYLNQSPKINYCGNLQFPSPRLDFTSAPEVTPPTCPNSRFQVRLQFANSGEDVVGNPVPVAFYQHDPQVAYSDGVANPHLETVYIDIPGGLQPGETLDTTIWVNGIPGPFTLYTSLNDIGPFDPLTGSSLTNAAFYPLDELNGTIRECDNNPDVISTPVNPNPFAVAASVAQDNTQCAGASSSDGVVTASVAGDTLGFVFRWYVGSVVKSVPDYLGATQTGLTGGTYLVVAEAAGVSCNSSSQTVQVQDLATPPVVVTSVLSEQVSCNPATPTGVLSSHVDAGGSAVTAGYDFFWYRGLNNVIPARPGYTGGATVDSLPSGDYRLVVFHAQTGCTTVEDVFLPENRVTPPIQLDNVVDVTVCDPALADGEAEVSVGGNTIDYDFYWYSGSVSSPDTTAVLYQGEHLQNVMDGDYTVFAADKVTRCLSDPLSVTMQDNSVTPVVNTEVVAPQSACDPVLYNGSLRATVDESATGGSANETNGYTFAWYAGTVTLATLPASPIETNHVLTGAARGNYSVVITNDATGCRTLQYRFLPEQILRPVMDLTATIVHADNCTDPWGSSIRVSADGGDTAADGYSFEWRDASNTVLPETSETLSNVPPGSYTVLVTNPLGCTAQNTAQYEVLDQAPKPTVTLQRFNNSSCDASQPNGVIAASGFVGAVGDYTFEWFTGSPSGSLISTNISSDGDSIFQLAAGTYALRITDNTSQCFSVAYTTIQNNAVPSPLIDTVSVTATTDCRAISADGEAIFEVVGGPQALPYDATTDRTYTFRLYAGTTATGVPIATNATGLFTGLNFNDYTATVEDDFTRCRSSPMTISIEQDPDITITRDHLVSPISCANADGEIGVTVNSPTNTSPTGAGYTFTWYSLGNSKNGVPTANPGSILLETGFLSRREGLTSGYYVVEVADNFTSCTVYDTLFLPQANPPSVATALTHSDQCTPGNGSIEVTLTPNGFSLDLYRVELYAGNSIDLGNALNSWEPADNSDDTYTFSALSPQRYTIGVIYKSSNCPVIDRTERIRMDNPDPAISFIPDADYSCNPDGTGSLNASVVGGGDNDATESNFTFEWFEGNNTSTPLAASQVDGADPSLAINLLEGYYTVQITDNSGPGNGCSYTETYYLPKQFKTIAISGTANLPDSVCGPTPTGNIWVETVTEDGVNVDTTGGYAFELLDETGTAPSFSFGGTGNASDPFTGLAEGDYFVKAVNVLTDCESALVAVRVENTSQPPTIAVEQAFPDYTCNGRPSTGELNASVVGGGDNDTTESNFTYTWFSGANNTNPADQLPAANIDPADLSRAIELMAGEYTVLVQDNAGHSNECSSTYTFTVDQVELQVVLTLGSDPQEKCDPVDGTVFVTDTQEEYFFNGTQVIPTQPSDYSYTLYDENLATVTIPGSGLSTDKFRDLSEGTYRVTTDSSSNCLSGPAQVDVGNISENPVVSIELITPQYSLNPDPSSWTGSLQAQAQVHPDQPLDSAADGFTYEYRWYTSSNYAVGNELNADFSDPTISQLDVGNYLVEITNLVTGCTNTTTFDVPFVLVEPQLVMRANPQTVCFADGSLMLDSVTFLGEVDQQEAYGIKLYATAYDTTQAAADSVINFSGTVPFDRLLAGTYYVRGFHQTLHLPTNLLQLAVEDVSTNPLVDLVDLQVQRSCDTTQFATGAVAIQAVESRGQYDPYTYQWFKGSTTDSTTLMAGETLAEIDSLPFGFYTVRVDNQRTQCSTIETIFIPEEISIPQITASATASSVCDPSLANGVVRVEPIVRGDYRYDWYVGDTVKAQADFSGQVWAGLMPGNYTVQATSMNTSTCVSAPITVAVIDVSAPPLVQVEVEEPYSSCDPLLANGLLYANVGGQTVGYEYIWYDSANNIVSEGPRAYNLTDQTYRVEVTDIATGCLTEAYGTVVRGERIVGMPEVEILSHMTDCINPNGSASVSVNGNVEDYIFLFYYSDATAIPDTLLTVSEDDLLVLISELQAGTYLVTATEYITNCVSDATTFEIRDESYVPPFRIETQPASCESANGTATIVSEVGLKTASVTWTIPDAGVVVSESYVTDNLPAGSVSVEVLWENGCTSYGSAVIEEDICVYNTVTPNGDGNHDFLEIGTIERYANNSVKIYNRAGSLVYQADRYNNQNNRFEGVGNRGLYVGGKKLPDGTYFYVIDKQDGTPPKTGYLELVN